MNVYRPPSVPAARRVRCLCLSIALVFGQLASAEPPRLDQLTHLGVEDGLSHSTVWDIHQDARGFLWLATSNELQRYDGYQFRTYSHDPDDPESLSIDEVMRILESRDGMLWFGTRGGGLNRFDPLQERFTR
ncbi:MAG: two-component regulator propeller domain-containing protein, partial [Acidobacteriota bacterium]